MLEGKKISELDPTTNLQNSCCFPVLNNGVTRKITYASLLSEIENDLPESGIDNVKEDVEALKIKSNYADEKIEVLKEDVKKLQNDFNAVDEMVQGQNATIRNCVSTVENIEQKIEDTHFDDILALEAEVRRNSAVIPTQASETNQLADKNYVENKTKYNNYNIISYPYYYADSITVNGVTYNVQDDGSISANGTATANAWYRLYNFRNFSEFAGKTLNMSCKDLGSESLVQIHFYDLNSTEILPSKTINDVNKHITFIVPNNTSTVQILLGVLNGNTVSNKNFKIMLNEGETPKDFCPNYYSSKEIKYLINNLFEYYNGITIPETTIESHSRALITTDVNASARDMIIPRYFGNGIFLTNYYVSNGKLVLALYNSNASSFNVTQAYFYLFRLN